MKDCLDVFLKSAGSFLKKDDETIPVRPESKMNARQFECPAQPKRSDIMLEEAFGNLGEAGDRLFDARLREPILIGAAREAAVAEPGSPGRDVRQRQAAAEIIVEDLAHGAG